jgi:tetratricopeptide (TPR) repeat protein
MLQVRNSIFIALLLAINVAGQSIDWLLEDAYEKEYDFLNDASVVLPDEVKTAFADYKAGLYRPAIEILEKLRNINMPDGRLDIISFILAESYRQLGLTDNARNEYRFIVNRFPGSDKVIPGLFRLLEYASSDSGFGETDSIINIFQTRFNKHPLFNAALYTSAKTHYMKYDYRGSLQILNCIDKNSSQYLQSKFLSALCFVHLKEYDKALIILDEVRKKSDDIEFSAEASLVIGDIYYYQNNIEAAVKYFKSVPHQSSRFNYSQLKCARAYLDLGKYKQAATIASKYIKKKRGIEYYFEMASVLEQIYKKKGKEKDAQRINLEMEKQVQGVKISFGIFDELSKLKNVYKRYQAAEYEAIRKNKQYLIKEIRDKKEKVLEVENKFNQLLFIVEPVSKKNELNPVPYLAERRYIELLKEKKGLIEDTIGNLGVAYNQISSMFNKTPQDTVLKKKFDGLSVKVESLRKEKIDCEHEYSLIINECFGKKDSLAGIDEQLQTKFIDFAFLKYLKKKDELKNVTQVIAESKKKNAKSSDKSKKYTENDRQLLNKSVSEDRIELIKHIETVLELYPEGRYNSQILFRLAELYFDDDAENFEFRLRVYEKKMAEGKDTAGIEFPEYDLRKTIKIYDQILNKYLDDDVADEACFYKALALQKQGLEDEANSAMILLTTRYPESEFFVEACMNVGNYYFNHPKINNGQGYKLAEETYKKVLIYRNHPQFVQALYHLGWCYYMQDRYDEAISAFKYLVEEGDLDFDPTRSEEKQVLNPLLRDEAIDYIAISFDEEGRMDDALKFLKLIGNTDYAALVFKRMAALREEDLDYGNAIKIYRRLLQEFPMSTVAPQASVELIKIYDSKGMTDSANLERNNFLLLYGKSSKWQAENVKKDSVPVTQADSMAILNGLSIADNKFRAAELWKNREDYEAAAALYTKVAESYPSDSRASEAIWNLAVILETKLDQKRKAYDQYINFSRILRADSSKREQASLNAIAIAQSLLPPDSIVQKGVVDTGASKLIEAVKNYLKLFPNGESYNKVLITMGAVYFNRQIYASSEKIYKQIIERAKSGPDFLEAMMLMGQCNFNEEKWPTAASIFEKVWKTTDNENQKSSAFKMLLQSYYQYAKAMMSSGEYEKAAVEFQMIDDKYPGSEYGDIVLFNASEAFEKKELWGKACDNYYELVNRYPQSRLAPEALFNAAGDYEKAQKYDKAAECYELIDNKYGSSDKAKDALFNLGFCYEKLQKPDKMAEANERYSAKYPEEKDVEAMLMRSASYYAKSGMGDRAIGVYSNFISRFPKSPKTVEARFMIAKINLDKGELISALNGFNDAEQQNSFLLNDNLEGNNYFAAEAAFNEGNIQHDRFVAVSLVLPEEQLRKSLKEKTDLLNEASKAYQHVIQYRSERMFEAAYKIGMLYCELADSWVNQERPKLDPLKEAVLEKDIRIFSSQCRQKAIIPFRKVLLLGSEFDSLGVEQKKWVQNAYSSLLKNYIAAGEDMKIAVNSMEEAPIPKEIRDEPLHYYQYLKQLLETLEPVKNQLRDYYSKVCYQLDTLKTVDSLADVCRDEFAQSCYATGYGYDDLSTRILKGTQEIPKDIAPEQREELIFQLEDIVYELQDKAILNMEDALKQLKFHNLQSSRWNTKVIESLARLSPEKYGKSFFVSENVLTNQSWFVRSDSVSGWNSSDVPRNGWSQAVADTSNASWFPGTLKPSLIHGDTISETVYIWKHVFLNGTPRNASVYISSSGKYRLYVNGSLILTDTVGTRTIQQIDSASGIVALVKGGDNVISAALVKTPGTGSKLAVLLSFLTDTTQRFKSSITLPNVKTIIQKTTEQKDSTKTISPASQKSIVKQYRSRAELLKAIENYIKRESESNSEIKHERLEIQKLRIRSEELENSIKKVRDEILKIKSEKNSVMQKK